VSVSDPPGLIKSYFATAILISSLQLIGEILANLSR
jgi:hypothetical protein